MNDARRSGGGGGIARRLIRFATTLAQYPFLFVLFLFRSLSTYKGGKALLYLSTMIVYAAVLVPFHELPVIAPIVEAFARERGLPYNAYSPLGIWRAHLAFLWRS